MLFSGGRGCFLALSATGQARGRWVLYDACLIQAELHDACFKHSKSLRWLFSQGVAFRLTEASRCMENPTVFFLQIARSAFSVF